jgi:hypothetical protein
MNYPYFFSLVRKSCFINFIRLILKKISDDNHINLRYTLLYKHKTEVDMINQDLFITQINNSVIPLSDDIQQLILCDYCN